MIFVIVSIDWELDFGKSNWDKQSGLPDYGGIIVGTPFVEKMLQDLGIPCTWLIETHVQLGERDTPRIFPGLVRQLSKRPLDEIGVHIHWSRKNGNGGICYPLDDQEWVLKQLEHSRSTFESLGLEPVMFRGGAFLGVRGLPRLLQRTGYSIDSSVLWNRCNRLELLQKSRPLARSMSILFRKNFGQIPSPYLCDPNAVEHRGNSNVMEFPVHFSLLSLLSPAYLISHALFFARISRLRFPIFLVLFFHIDEITDPSTGPNELTQVDHTKVNKMRNFLQRLKKLGAVKFGTFREAKELILASGSRLRGQ